MIYSDEFVWVHFPKCAGTKIENMFLKYFFDEKSIVQDVFEFSKDPLIKWHDTIANREKRDPDFKLGSRVVIFPIRRLPSWLESRYNFEVSRSPELPNEPEILLKGNYFNKGGNKGNANDAIRLYLPENIIKSNEIKFIRVENFEADFKEIFGKYVDVSKVPNAVYSHKANSSRNYIPETIRQQLYDPKNDLYELSPYWKMVEDIAYNGKPYTPSF